MSKYDDAPPGTLTRADLVESLRVNRALLVAAQGDVDYRDARIAKEQERIAEHTARIAEHIADAASATERIARIRSTIERQERELAALGEEKRVAQLSDKKRRQEQVEAILLRIKQGDMAAVTELQKLL